jgi:Uma2 family endonuclease
MATTQQKFTFEAYQIYNDGTDTRYELVDGDLVPMSLGTGKHGSIIRLLERRFEGAIQQIAQPWIALPGLVGVRSPRGTRWDTSRIPDVTVLPLAQWEDLQEREAIINLNEPAPILVVEVVSESTKAVDYRAKYSEYSVLEITEYWIVDPLDQKVTVCELNEGRYDDAVFTGDEIVQSTIFPVLQLTAEQILIARL